MCVYADDILDTDPEHWPKRRGDEDMIVLDLPKKLRRRKLSPDWVRIILANALLFCSCRDPGRRPSRSLPVQAPSLEKVSCSRAG
jgi:hypothetical protein